MSNAKSRALSTASRAVIVGVALAGFLASAQADTIRYWTTEEQPERLATQEEVAKAFQEATGHTVEVIPVSESDLGTRA
ncbi:MAG: hypothetical protein AAGF49_11670, partial [Pseudomonadota bacterium]